MEILAGQRLLGVCAIVMAMGFANAVQGEAAPPVVVGLAKCSDCTRKNMNAEAAFKGLQVVVKCRNGNGEYESTAVGPVDKSGAFSVPLDADLVGDDGELRRECFAQLHSASSEPCPGQEPSKIVAASADHGSSDKTFVALGGEVHRSSPECASAFLCYPFLLHHHHHHVGIHKPVVIPHEPDHGHGHGDGHSLPPVTKPPVDVPEHKPPVPVPEHSAPPSTPVYTPPSTPVPVPEHTPPPSTPVYTPPSTPTPIYHPPAQRNAVADP